jgi:hypothetical protein
VEAGASGSGRSTGLRYPSDMTDAEWALVAPADPPGQARRASLPAEKWSSLRYGFGPCGGRIDVEEAAQA